MTNERIVLPKSHTLLPIGELYPLMKVTNKIWVAGGSLLRRRIAYNQKDKFGMYAVPSDVINSDVDMFFLDSDVYTLAKQILKGYGFKESKTRTSSGGNGSERSVFECSGHATTFDLVLPAGHALTIDEVIEEFDLNMSQLAWNPVEGGRSTEAFKAGVEARKLWITKHTWGTTQERYEKYLNLLGQDWKVEAGEAPEWQPEHTTLPEDFYGF